MEGFEDVSKILGPGVYGLYWVEELVYVGKATKLLQRIYTHRNLWERKRSGKPMPKTGPQARARAIAFSKVMIRPCELSDLDRLETELIARFRPKYNTLLVPQGKISLAEMGLELNVWGTTISFVEKEVKHEGFVRRF